MKVRLFWLASLAAIVPALLSAQEAERTVQVEFSVFSPEGGRMDRMFFPGPGGQPQSLTFRTSNRSPVQLYNGPARMRFFDYTGTYGAEDFVVIPKAAVDIPQGASRVLLLFFRDPGGPLPYRIFLMSDTERALPNQSAIIFNASGRPIFMAQGNNQVPLAGGPTSPFRIDERGTNFQFFYQLGDNFRTVFNDIVRCRPNERVIIFILPPVFARSIEVRVRILREVQIEEPPTTPPVVPTTRTGP